MIAAIERLGILLVAAGLIVLMVPAVLAEEADDEQGVGARGARVTLEDPGEEPRRSLRYEVEPGLTEQVEIRLDLRYQERGRRPS